MSNVNPQPSKDAEELKARLSAQMTGGVRWREIMLKFNELEVSEAWEVGPGKVLTGLIKRTCSDIQLNPVNSGVSF
ncbi:MAG: ACP S-malonyltransferase [Synechococcaceae cyanobacterium RL_1_2]|nr:ACP S-malonyltransferase [Synechococcaceae cyanobacterium RL_1_2]